MARTAKVHQVCSGKGRVRGRVGVGVGLAVGAYHEGAPHERARVAHHVPGEATRYDDLLAILVHLGFGLRLGLGLGLAARVRARVRARDRVRVRGRGRGRDDHLHTFCRLLGEARG